MNLQDFIAKYQQLVDTVLASGPDLQDDLADLTTIRDAALRIRDRTIRRFGVGAAAETLTDEQLQQLLDEPKIKAANQKLGKALGGVSGPFVDTLMQLIQLAMTNPALLQMILTLFQRPAKP